LREDTGQPDVKEIARDIIYGSFATAVVALLITEAAALIVLLGAQVIAELEHPDHSKGQAARISPYPSRC
jgi:uncharacterized BrkB/YihY/UPF0761 family membrane protein